MNREELKERGIQVLALVPIALLIAALTCPATDLEPPWGDATADDAPPSVDDPDADDPPPDDFDGAGPGAGEDGEEAPPLGPPALATVRCTSPEIAAGGACVIVGPHSCAVRWRMDREAFGGVTCAGARGDASAEASRGLDEQRLVVAPLVPAVAYSCTVEAWNDDGRATLAVFGLETLGDAPWIAVTEVLGNPTGAEPTQEFVELANLDSTEVDLTGWALEDEGGGAPLPEGTVLLPGDVALLVPDDYDPDGAGDPAAAATALLVRIGRSIGSMGLRNSGESVYLLDPSGAVVSSYPNNRGALPDGVSVMRLPPQSPEADEGAWGESGSAGPTPGRL
jgi:hypothetical protein